MPNEEQVAFEVHISSMIVLCKPDAIENAVEKIVANPLAEVHAVDESGKIIVVLETPSEQNILDGIQELENIDGVISATLVYHQVD